MKLKGEVGGNGLNPEPNRIQIHGHLSRGLFDNVGRKGFYDKEDSRFNSSAMRTQSTVTVECRYTWLPKTYLGTPLRMCRTNGIARPGPILVTRAAARGKP